jgi:hypothetical protein
MTAEIAILNSSGIALAADSAVTIADQKVYNSANKLFTLSKYQPVGIMVYDSADLMGIPWEIIIKEYRRKLGKKYFPTLKEYAEDFWSFLKDDNVVIPAESKDLYAVTQAESYLRFVFRKLEEAVKKKIESQGGATLADSYSLLLDVLRDTQPLIYDAEFLTGLTNSDSEELCSRYREQFDATIKDQFGELYDLLSEDNKKLICSHIANLFVRNKFVLRTSGVVIAGYGTEEMFPRIASYQVEGIIGNLVKMRFNEGKSNIQNDTFVTTIVPFAQDEMVWTFISGIDPEVTKFASTYLDDLFRKYPSSLDSAQLGTTDEILSKIRDKLVADGVLLLQQFNNDLYKFQRKNNSQPILDMVGVLPKDELAAMAESLVNLTVFKRKVSKAVETVGGPIDVAVISKGDGFIWVKRKHYFKAELNQHFFANYFSEVKNE